MSRLQHSLDQLAEALARLHEAFEQPVEAPLVLDGTIQRFEFAFELFWKAFMLTLADSGIETRSPREAIRGAYAAGIVASEDAWLALLRARNLTTHTYNQTLARQVYEVVRASMHSMDSAMEALREGNAADK